MTARVGEPVYKMVSQVRICEDNGQIEEYGIELWDSASPGEGRLSCRWISSCRETAAALLERLSRHRVSPAHFFEMVEDYLDELYSS